MQSEKPVPCREIAVLVARTSPPASKPTPVWGVELVGGPTDATALAAYRRLEQNHASILGAARPTSCTMDWGAAPWVGPTCTSGLTTVPARRNYVRICVALA